VAGFLAPQLNEISAAPGVRPPPSNSVVGDALSGAASIIDLLGRGRSSLTQSDKDDAALKPYFDRLISLVEQRDSGGMPPDVATLKIRSLIRSTVSNFSHLRETIFEGAGDIAGESFDFREPIVGNEIVKRDTDFAFTDPEARARLSEAIVRNKDGTINNRKTLLGISALVKNIQATRSDLALRKAEIESLTQENSFTNEKQAELIDPLLTSMAVISRKGIQGATDLFLSQSPEERSSTDAPAIIAELNRIKADYSAIFIEQAGSAGVLDEERFTRGLAQVLAPFDNMIKTFTQLAANPNLIDEIQNSEERILLREFANSVGSLLTPEFAQSLGIDMLVNSKAEISTKLPAFQKIIKQTKVELSTAGETVVDGELTDGAVDTIITFSPKEVKEDVVTALDAWDTIDLQTDETLVEEDSRRFYNEKFGVATGIITTTGEAINEETFNRMFGTQFFKRYDRMTAIDDEVTRQFKKSVRNSLSNILDRRRVLVNQNLTNSFSRDFPSLGLKWNGSSFVLVMSQEDGPKTQAEKNLLESLSTESLPFTLEGVEELGRRVRRQQLGIGDTNLDPQLVRAFNISTINTNQPIFLKLKDSVGMLNKVVGTIKVLPDEISSEVLPTKEEVGDTTAVLEIDTFEELNSLEPGTRFHIKGTPLDRVFTRKQEEIMSEEF